MNQYSLSIVGPGQIIFLTLLVVIVPLVIYILFNITLQRAMNAVSSKNRKMEGGLIWLNLIPILNVFWPFVYNAALRSSYKNEFQEKRITHRVNLVAGFVYPGAQILSLIIYAIGVTIAEEMVYDANYYQNMSTAYDALFVYQATMILVGLLGLVGLILWIIFWVNVSGLRSILVAHDRNVTSLDQKHQQTTNADSIPQNTFQQTNASDQQLETDYKQPLTAAATVSPKPIIEPVKQVSSIDKLMKYHEMLSEGLITQADFDKVKNELLNQK